MRGLLSRRAGRLGDPEARYVIFEEPGPSNATPSAPRCRRSAGSPRPSASRDAGRRPKCCSSTWPTPTRRVFDRVGRWLVSEEPRAPCEIALAAHPSAPPVRAERADRPRVRTSSTSTRHSTACSTPVAAPCSPRPRRARTCSPWPGGCAAWPSGWAVGPVRAASPACTRIELFLSESGRDRRRAPVRRLERALAAGGFPAGAPHAGHRSREDDALAPRT